MVSRSKKILELLNSSDAIDAEKENIVNINQTDTDCGISNIQRRISASTSSSRTSSYEDSNDSVRDPIIYFQSHYTTNTLKAQMKTNNYLLILASKPVHFNVNQQILIN